MNQPQPTCRRSAEHRWIKPMLLALLQWVGGGWPAREVRGPGMSRRSIHRLCAPTSGRGRWVETGGRSHRENGRRRKLTDRGPKLRIVEQGDGSWAKVTDLAQGDTTSLDTVNPSTCVTRAAARALVLAGGGR
jgi:hypothetical protein